MIREDNAVRNQTYVYTYDNAGNILSKKTYALTAAGTTPTSPQSTKIYTYGNAKWGDQLTAIDGNTITYDALGNPLSYYNGLSSFTFTWENGRQLSTATKGSYTLSFNYDENGHRTSKTVNGVEHVYYLDGSRIVAETWGNNLCIYLYDVEGSPIGMQYRTASYAESVFDTYWFEKNLQGDIVTVYNESGTKLVQYTYDAWGNHSTLYYTGGHSTGAKYNPFRYRGYYYDSETGFYYLQSRYYDPAIGRFINADGLVNGTGTILGYNLFTYCGNNPVMYTDSTGEFAIGLAILLKIAVAAVVTIAACVFVEEHADDITEGIQAACEFVDDATAVIGDVFVRKDRVLDKADEKEKVDPIPPEPNSQAYFPQNPYDFNPRGLERVVYPGTSNGRVIKWRYSNTKRVVFEWDEDFKYGSHYHISDYIGGSDQHTGDHWYAGDPVPEPWNSLFF